MSTQSVPQKPEPGKLTTQKQDGSTTTKFFKERMAREIRTLR